MSKLPSLLRNCINPDNIAALAQRIIQNHKPFDGTGFTRLACQGLADNSLGDRIQQVRRALKQFLPEDFDTAVAILIESLGPKLANDDLGDIDLSSPTGFIVTAQTAYVARYGLDHFDTSMQAFHEMTQRFSAEGSIRYFLKAHEEKTLAVLAQWCDDPSPHVRRLVSEGTRPRLPMMMRLHQYVENPKPVLALLEKLKDDPCLFVRRSVANNLNDIAKDNPQLVTDTLERWNQVPSRHTAWVTQHALRSLVKQGSPAALRLLGYDNGIDIQVKHFELDKQQISLGNTLNIQLQLEAPQPGKLMIDYVIHHMKANGQHRPKVFKWAKKEIQPGETLSLEKRHAVREITTRKYYPGQHRLELQVNGRIVAETTFNLKL